MNKMRLAVFEGALTTGDFAKHSGISAEQALSETICHVREMEQTEKMLRHRIVELKRDLRKSS